MTKPKNGSPLTQAFYLLCLIGTSHAACAADGADGPGNEAAIKKLLTQASYWHSKAHDDMAIEALQKVLVADASNVDAMYLMSLYNLQRGDTQQAEAWRKRISDVSPQDPRLNALTSAHTMQTLSPSQLNAARDMARRGQTKEALAAYRALFNGTTPPDDLALEYYQTMAGDSASLPDAVAGLRQRASTLPGDAPTRLALATTLTYQESTRREGISQLDALAPEDKNADKALQQALLWLTPKADDLAAYTRYAGRHPEDSTPMDHYRQGTEGDATKAGFDALNGGDLTAAKENFSAILKTRASDGNALAGLGYVAMRQNNFADAQRYLSRAVSADAKNPNSAQWAKDAENVQFYAALGQAKSQSQKGSYAQAIASLDAVQGNDASQRQAAQILRADILRRQGKPNDA
nr:tetratricopeptide repeat protein [uncultured Enterobacter sp.]